MKPTECQAALGMENGAISDRQITASSQWDANKVPARGRLHFNETSSKAGAWSSATADQNQWLQVDLGCSFVTVTGVATQGRNVVKQWVIKYNLQYSDDGLNFHYFKEQGQITKKVKIDIIHRKETLLIRDLEPTLNDNVSSEKLWLY